MSSLLVLRAYLDLIHFDWLLTRGNFGALCGEVRNYPIERQQHPPVIEQICAVVDMACIWYWKEVRCLQRSAVTTCMLRRCGVPAQMVMGAQELPFRAHAWTEVDGRAIHERRDVQKIYAVLERC